MTKERELLGETVMGELKATPGPWWFEGQGIGPKSFADDQSYGMTTPVAYIEEYDWPENHVANAHLIAAAPELYETLEEVIRISDRKHDAWDKAKAALAKARGEA